MNSLNQYEIGILHSMHDALECDFADAFFSTVTHLADAGILWILLAVVLLWFRKTRRAGITMGIALVFGLVAGNLILKPLTARIRPYDFDASIALIIPPEIEFSFPSGHTLASFEGAFGLFLCHRKWGIPAIILAACIAFSRLYLMVHYPIDVVTGAILGILFAVLAYKLTDFIIAKIKSPPHNSH